MALGGRQARALSKGGTDQTMGAGGRGRGQSREAKIYKGEEINEAMAEHGRGIARLLESGDP